MCKKSTGYKVGRQQTKSDLYRCMKGEHVEYCNFLFISADVMPSHVYARGSRLPCHDLYTCMQVNLIGQMHLFFVSVRRKKD